MKETLTNLKYAVHAGAVELQMLSWGGGGREGGDNCNCEQSQLLKMF